MDVQFSRTSAPEIVISAGTREGRRSRPADRGLVGVAGDTNDSKICDVNTRTVEGAPWARLDHGWVSCREGAGGEPRPCRAVAGRPRPRLPGRRVLGRPIAGLLAVVVGRRAGRTGRPH